MAVLAQAFLAGLALSGSQDALRAHTALGGVTLLLAAVQAVAAFLLRRNPRNARTSRRLVGASIAFFGCRQCTNGSGSLFALHLPLGVALFGAAVALAIYAWAWRSGQFDEPLKSRAGRLALNGLPMVERT
jgi:asparagine N-glycosylation enzyme membrane subunit Stt3